MRVSGLPRLDDLRAERAERRLHAHVEMHWPAVEKKAPFQSNWHIGAICEHLEAVTLGQLTTDILMNIPPGCMKSYLVSVFWPTWEWGPKKRPDLRYLCGSYDEGLSVRDNRRSRDIIESELYQRYWPVTLRPDQNTKTRYDNTESGWRIGTSVGGKGTGEHPHRKIIDDPHNVKQSLSDLQRKEALTWFGLTMGSRGVALKAITLVIMQRLHHEDLSGHILETLREQYTVICLPMRYEPPAWVEVRAPLPGDPFRVERRWTPRMPPTPLGFQDPRTTPGELLWPSLFDAKAVDKLETQLRTEHGEFGVAGQMQQRPVPMKGGLFQREWFRIVDAIPAEAQIVARGRGWDMAASENKGDYTAGVRIALARNGNLYVEDVARGQWGPERFEGEDGLFKQIVTLDGPGVRQREEREGGSAGKKVILSHVKLLAGYDFKGETVSGDKPTRAAPFIAQASVGNVFLVRGPWNKAYIDELAEFPNGKHDDQVDASSACYNDLALGRKVIGEVRITGA